MESMPTRIVWLTFIAVMDEMGFVQFASVANVAHRARVSIEEAQAAIACLEGEDPDSSDLDHNGRRIERVPGGWMVLNAEKHREMVTAALIRDQTRDRVRRFRERRKGDAGNAPVTPSEALARAEAEVLARSKKNKNERTPASPENSRTRKRGNPEKNFSLIVTLIRKELDGVSDEDMVEAAKLACAKHKIAYNSQVIRKAVDAVIRAD